MGYIVGNIDKKEYLRPEAFGEKDDLVSVVHSYQGITQALIVLLADGNNRGGGDLRSDAPIIGTWAGDRVILVDDTAVLPEFSEPGMEAIPYQKQLVSLGKDVSAEVVAAIIDGEGDYSRLSQLNPNHVLPLVIQSDIQEAGGTALLTEEGRQSRIVNFFDLFGLVGEKPCLSPVRQRETLQRGVNRIAEMLGRTERYSLIEMTTKTGKKAVPSRYGRADNPFEQTVGANSAKFVFEHETGEKHPLIAKFDAENGTKVCEFFEALFPGIVFEHKPEPATRSEEVAKLLSFLNKPVEGAN